MAYFWKGVQKVMTKKLIICILICLASIFLMSHNTSAYSQHVLFRDSANGNTIVDGQTQYENYFGTYSADFNFYNEQVKTVNGNTDDVYTCESYKRSFGYATSICVADKISFQYLDFFGGNEKPANGSFLLPKGDYTIEVSQQNQFFDWTTNDNSKYFFNILKGKNLANTDDLHAIESAGISFSGNYDMFEKITLQNYYCAGSNCFFRFLFRVNEDKTISFSLTDVLSLTMNLTSFQEGNNIYYLYNDFVSAVPFGNSVYNKTIENHPLVELSSYDYGSVPDTEPTNPDMTLNDLNNSLNDINNTLKDQYEQEKQGANSAVDDSKNSSNSSSSDVTNNSSTQSLLSVITGFFGAITSAKPSSCVLTGKINDYLTPSFDFCQLDPPPALTALLSIPVAIAIFFFSKHMLNKIISLIRSFQ